nr:AAA family ATPase [uncultured Porphyromonas sp.]
MIRQIIIENYKSIREATIDLAPINVMIGSNGAGKSNLISFFELLSALYDQRLQRYILRRGGMGRLLHNGLKGSDGIRGLFNFNNRNAFCFELIPSDQGGAVVSTWDYFNNVKSPQANYKAWHLAVWDSDVLESQIRDNKTWRAGYLKDFLQSFTVYHFHDTSRTSAMRQACPVEDNRFLQHDASNLPAFLYVLQEQEPKAFTAIERTIQSIAPYFKRFNLAPSKRSPDQISLVWEEQDSDMYLDAQSLSDGTLRFIALATLLLQPKPPKTIVIDEPELGLHPAAIEKLSGLVRVASQRGAQVLIATQSSSLVSCFEPEDILVVERKDGSTVFSRPDKERLASWLEDYSLGELWEKNLIGGKP